MTACHTITVTLTMIYDWPLIGPIAKCHVDTVNVRVLQPYLPTHHASEIFSPIFPAIHLMTGAVPMQDTIRVLIQGCPCYRPNNE